MQLIPVLLWILLTFVDVQVIAAACLMKLNLPLAKRDLWSLVAATLIEGGLLFWGGFFDPLLRLFS